MKYLAAGFLAALASGALVAQTTGTDVDPSSIFDVQVKRIHEYKRQSLNVLRIIAEYQRLIEDAEDSLAPRTYIFAGKAAPGYWAAKQIIKLIHSVGNLINNDARVKDRLKVIFIPDYRVSLAEVIMPAADIFLGRGRGLARPRHKRRAQGAQRPPLRVVAKTRRVARG